MKIKRTIQGSISTALSQRNSADHVTKFDLFVQSRRIKQLTLALDEFLQTLQYNHSSWLVENQDLVERFLEELLDDSMLVLDGIQLDAEGMELSVSLMSDIRRALSVVEQMMENSGQGVN